MYSWIASWFSEDENEATDKEQVLYALQQNNQNPSPADEEWTYIEVIETENHNGLIFIQSDESIRNKAVTMIEPFQQSKRKRKARRISRIEELGAKVFRKSLYTELPLIQKTYRPMRRVKRCAMSSFDDMSAAVGNDFCWRQKTTSEILSLTFPGKTDNQSFMVRKRSFDDFDVSRIIKNTSFIRCLLERDLQHEVQLQHELQIILEELLKRQKTAVQQTAELTDGWKKSGQFCIEWKSEISTGDEEDIPQIKIVKKRYRMCGWLKRINVFEKLEDFPDWLKKINVSYFHQSCGELLQQPFIVENITDVPKWLQRMDACSPLGLSKVRRKNNRPPAWVRKLNVFDDVTTGFDYLNVPSWLTKIDVYEKNEAIKSHIDLSTESACSDYQNKRVYEPGCYNHYRRPGYDHHQSQWVTPRKTWLRPINSDGVVNNVQYLYNSMINIATILATTTCNKGMDTSSKMKSTDRNETEKSWNKNMVLTTAGSGEAWEQNKRKARETTTTKKNKKWMRRMNVTSKVRNEKKKKHAARTFSGGKCVRAR